MGEQLVVALPGLWAIRFRRFARTVASGSDVNPLRNRRRSDMAFHLNSGGIIVGNRGMTLTEFYQQKSRRLRHQSAMGVQILE
jgi:hypothetical protein